MRTQAKKEVHTVGAMGEERLTALALRVGFGEQLEPMLRLFRTLVAPWSHVRCGSSPPWPSDVCDDHTPFELSVATGGAAPELRLLVESRGETPTLASNEAWGLEVNQLLRRDYGVQLDRFDAVRDLFLPVADDAMFALWHAVSFWPNRPPEFKCYLNVNARGPAEAPRLVQEALRRLGFDSAWPAIAETALGREGSDRLAYFSLDLSPTAARRVKVYARHLDCTVDDLERACSAARNYQPGCIAEFCRVLSAGEQRFTGRGPVSCLSFVEGDTTRPSAGTLYFPIAAYAPNDRIARNRIASYLVLHELPTAAYVEPLAAFAARPLEAGIGMQSYASLRWTGDKPRVTVYFSPEAYHVQPPRPLLRASDASRVAGTR
jgi:DMATS type aromatic prenyltransferase